MLGWHRASRRGDQAAGRSGRRSCPAPLRPGGSPRPGCGRTPQVRRLFRREIAAIRSHSPAVTTRRSARRPRSAADTGCCPAPARRHETPRVLSGRMFPGGCGTGRQSGKHAARSLTRWRASPAGYHVTLAAWQGPRCPGTPWGQRLYPALEAIRSGQRGVVTGSGRVVMPIRLDVRREPGTSRRAGLRWNLRAVKRREQVADRAGIPAALLVAAHGARSSNLPVHDLWSEEETAGIEAVAAQDRLHPVITLQCLACGRRKPAACNGAATSGRASWRCR